MAWYVYVAHVLGGAFLANAVPHFVNGISGRPFPSPFAAPPGKGESSPLVNASERHGVSKPVRLTTARG